MAAVIVLLIVLGAFGSALRDWYRMGRPTLVEREALEAVGGCWWLRGWQEQER